MIKNIKSKWRQIHISKEWIRINQLWRFNKKTKQFINIKNRQPNLIILGSQKCATTSLFHYLNKHPDIVGSSPQKEPGFFLFKTWAQNFWRNKGIILNNKESMLKKMMFHNLTTERYFMDASTYYTQD